MCKEVSNLESSLSCRRSLSVEVNGTEESSLRNAFSINSLILSTFHCWKKSFNRGMFLFTLSHGSYVVDQRSGDGRNSGRSSDVAVKSEGVDSRILRCLVRRLRPLWRRSSRTLLQEESQSRGAEGADARPISPRKTDCVHDLRILPGNWRTWSCSRTRQVLSSTSKVHHDKILESLYKMRIRESDQLAMFEQKNNQHLSKPCYQKLKTMVKRQKDQKNQDAKFQVRNERIRQEYW